jgi:hypothetical protein
MNAYKKKIFAFSFFIIFNVLLKKKYMFPASSKLQNNLMQRNVSMTKYSRGKHLKIVKG